MNTETEQILSDVANVKNTFDKRGRVIKPAVRVSTYRERETMKREKLELESMLSRTNAYATATGLSQEGRKTMQRRVLALEDRLEAESPQPLTGEGKDGLNKRLQELNDKIRVGMPTVEVMRRNPPGAVDQHRKWERANKSFILERQNILRTLNPDDDSKDLTNIDMIRPSGLPDGTSSFMADAFIPGHFAMTPAAKGNWPLGEPKLDTPLKQAERAEAQEVKAAPKKRPRKPMTPEQFAAARERGIALAQRAAEVRMAKMGIPKSNG